MDEQAYALLLQRIEQLMLQPLEVFRASCGVLCCFFHQALAASNSVSGDCVGGRKFLLTPSFFAGFILARLDGVCNATRSVI